MILLFSNRSQFSVNANEEVEVKLFSGPVAKETVAELKSIPISKMLQALPVSVKNRKP